MISMLDRVGQSGLGAVPPLGLTLLGVLCEAWDKSSFDICMFLLSSLCYVFPIYHQDLRAHIHEISLKFYPGLEKMNRAGLKRF